MITGDQIVLHLIGDYLTQSQWMADNKTKRSWPALCHATVYSLPFLLVTRSWVALLVIWGSHFAIDRYRLARYVVWLKNGPFNSWQYGAFGYRWRVNPTPPVSLFRPITNTGYPDSMAPWMATWLLIFADNTIHLIINGLAIWAFP
jgi:hypothetical protein